MDPVKRKKPIAVESRKGGNSDSGPASAPRWRRDLAGHLVFALVVAAVSGLLAWKVVPEVLRGEFVEPDNYMRLLRVQGLVERGEWYSNIIPRSNFPYGEVLHWTRPVDLVILGLSLPLLVFLRSSTALYIAGVVLAPLTLILICFAVGWAVIPLAGRRVRYLAMIAALAQPGLVGYALPGRPDHHPLLFLTFALSLGLGVRWLTEHFNKALALATGASLGFGVWLSTEYSLPLAVFLATGFAVWVLDREETARKNLWFSAGLAGLLILALVLEHPPSGLFEVEYDRISAPHVFVGLLVLAFWIATTSFQARGTILEGWKGRLGWGALGGASAFGLLVVTYPKFLQGPEAGIDPDLWPIWRNLIQETQPLMPDLSLGSVGTAVAYLGPVGFAVPFLLWALVRDWKSGSRGAWLLLLVSLGLFSPIALRFARFVTYPEIAVAMVIAVLINRVRWRVGRNANTFLSTLGRSLASAGLIVGCLWLGAILTIAAGQSGSQVRAAEAAFEDACPVSRMARFLGAPDGVGDRPRTVLAHLDYGPEILYRSKHRVIGTPFQRNAQGILDSFAIFTATDPAEARRLIETRGVDLILVCPQDSWIYSVTNGPEGPLSLHDLLLAGEPPDWLEPIPVPRDIAGELLLYRVRDRPRPPALP